MARARKAQEGGCWAVARPWSRIHAVLPARERPGTGRSFSHPPGYPSSPAVTDPSRSRRGSATLARPVRCSRIAAHPCRLTLRNCLAQVLVGLKRLESLRCGGDLARRAPCYTPWSAGPKKGDASNGEDQVAL